MVIYVPAVVIVVTTAGFLLLCNDTGRFILLNFVDSGSEMLYIYNIKL